MNREHTFSNNNFKIIENNMNEIKSLNNWDNKIELIKKTKSIIYQEKNNLKNLKLFLSQDLDEEIEFEKFDIKKSINKIKKQNDLNKKIQNLKYLKLWFKKQQEQVLNIN